MKNVAVFFGGRSAEHDISIITAISAVMKPLDITGEYKVIPVYISKDGFWYTHGKLKEIKTYQSNEIDQIISKEAPLSIKLGNGLVLEKTKKFNSKETIKVEIGFPAMHGTHGEDGELMGVLQMANIPYVGCDLTSSAIAMDKVLCSDLVKSSGVSTPKRVHFTKSEFEERSKTILEVIKRELQMPLFVKPARLGSSIGITKIKNPQELSNAIEVALHYDNKALVEESINNLIEVTVPIIGNNDLILGLVEQPLVKDGETFDFETKYLHSGKSGGKKMGSKGIQGYSNLPAQIPDDLYKKSEQTALAAYKAIGCQGIARVDLLIDQKSKEVYFNEINPLPGDLYKHNWSAAGISTVKLVNKLIQFAQERWEENNRTITTFKTNFLKQF